MGQVPVVRKLDSAIHWINYHDSKDSAIGFRNTFPLDSDLSGGYLALSNSVLLQPGPEENHIVYTTTGEISAI